MTNHANTVLYTGVTSDLARRVWEHKEGITGGFTSKYNVSKLVYFEEFDSIVDAIEREKQIKGGSRNKKIRLIESINPSYLDLSDQLPEIASPPAAASNDGVEAAARNDGEGL
jgi:putative endonuclease